MWAVGRVVPALNAVRARAFESNREAEERKQQQKEKEEDELLIKKQELRSQVLPWNLEQKVSLYLNPIKIPLVLIVTVLGCYVEHQIKRTKLTSWKATWNRPGPTCWVHELDEDLINPDIQKISNFLNSTFYPFTHQINEELQKSKHCKPNARNHSECNFFNLPSWLNFEVDYCGITEMCAVQDEKVIKQDEKGYFGLAWRLPFVPFSLVWAIYKLVFLPFYPIDRIANFLQGYPHPMPEPVFKLLTEPFSTRCALFMNMCAKVGKVIRYSLLPNTMMLPLFTMSKRRSCSKYIFYDMDTMFGAFIYAYVLVDLIAVIVGYIIGKFIIGECIQSWKYRLYKVYWYFSLWVSIILWIIDIVFTFDARFWKGLFLWLDMTFVFDPNLSFAIDVCRKLLGLNMLLDYFQLVILILSIVLPRCPCLNACGIKDPDDDSTIMPANT